VYSKLAHAQSLYMLNITILLQIDNSLL